MEAIVGQPNANKDRKSKDNKYSKYSNEVRVAVRGYSKSQKNRIFISTNLNYLWAEPGVLKSMILPLAMKLI